MLDLDPSHNGPVAIEQKLRQRGIQGEDVFDVIHQETARAQWQVRLRDYRAEGVDEYDLWCAPDACDYCKGLAAKGPFLVAKPVLPDHRRCPTCRCSIAPV